MKEARMMRMEWTMDEDEGNEKEVVKEMNEIDDILICLNDVP